MANKHRLTLITLLLVASIVFFASAAFAGPASVIPVEIKAKTYDPVGDELAKKTAELFKKDKGFMVVTGSDEPRLVIHLSTMGYVDQGGKKLTAYSVALAFDLPGHDYPSLIGSTVGICDSKEVPDDAKGIVYNTSKLIENYPDLMDKVQKQK